MAVRILEVKDKETLQKFVEFNLELYKNCPYHVPTLISDEILTLSKEKNPAFEFCESIYYLAYQDDAIVGRIAGLINHRANESWNQQYARFGFLDFVDDFNVSSALFKAVESWAKKKGMQALHGPLGFTDLDHEGLLVEGFDQLGTMVGSYSYPYYKEHLAKLGFQKDVDWHEFRITLPREVPEKYRRLSEIVAQRYNLRLLKFKRTREIWPYASRIFELWNEAYKPLYGYSELSPKQIEYYVKMYIPMLRLDLISFVVDKNDNIVAIGITLPSLSLALQKAKGRLLPLGWAHLMKAMYGKNDVVDLYIIGVAPKYQNKGIISMIFNDLIPVFNEKGYKYAESNPELELNAKVQSMWGDFEKKHHKTRRAFIKQL